MCSKIRLEEHLEENTKEIRKNFGKKAERNTNLEQTYKTEIHQYLKENPQTYRAEVKRNLRKQFKWLYHHCRDWINQNIPLMDISERYKYLAKDRVNWEERDKMLENKVKKVICKIKAKPNYPKITVGLISNELERYNFHKQMDKLPLTKAIIMENIENTEQSQKRRITNTVNRLISENYNITKNLVIWKTNLDKPLSNELDKYIDDLIQDLT